MKADILNDLHIEFGDFKIPDTDADVIILAGDIGVGTEGLAWIEGQNLSKPVIYIPGNHEFYHNDICLIDELKAQAPDNIHVLKDDAVVIDGLRFLGSILWTDFLLFGETDKYFSVQCARRGMNDFEIIRNNGRRFTPEDSIEMHKKSRDWLSCMLSEPFDGKTVVVTHHAPSSRSVPLRFANELFLFGFKPDNFALTDANIELTSSLPTSNTELGILNTWMDNGGGIFATGDHDYLGASMCYRIPRVGSMRRWTNDDGVPPIDGPTRLDTNQPSTPGQ